MFPFFNSKKKKKPDSKNKKETFETVAKIAGKSADFKESRYRNPFTGKDFSLYFVTTMIDPKILQEDVLPSLLSKEFHSIDDLVTLVPILDIQISKKKKTSSRNCITATPF
ncbi:hypothetical protein ACPJHQ_20135 [Rossellomorea sp. H39__3]